MQSDFIKTYIPVGDVSEGHIIKDASIPWTPKIYRLLSNVKFTDRVRKLGHKSMQAVNIEVRAFLSSPEHAPFAFPPSQQSDVSEDYDMPEHFAGTKRSLLEISGLEQLFAE